MGTQYAVAKLPLLRFYNFTGVLLDVRLRVPMKVKEAIEMIEKDGWFMVRRKGSHRQFKHNYKTGLVTIAGHLNDDLAKGTINSIFKQAGLNYGRKENV